MMSHLKFSALDTLLAHAGCSLLKNNSDVKFLIRMVREKC